MDSTDQWAEVWRDSQLSAASASLAPLLALEFIPHLVEEGERERILRKLPEQVNAICSLFTKRALKIYINFTTFSYRGRPSSFIKHN